MTVYSAYYAQFEGETFVIQAEDEAVENQATTRAILEGIEDLLRHGIRVLLVFGKPARFEAELRTRYAAQPHPETNRLVIPETALPRIREERVRIARAIEAMCEEKAIACDVVPESVIRVERRIGHGSTGVPTGVDAEAIRSVLAPSRLAVLGFGGVDESGRFLHVPSVTLAADLAVALGAQKLLFLTSTDGVSVPDSKKGSRRLSFVDLEELLCLLQRRDQRGDFAISNEALPKVHASIRAVAGGVGQVHLVSYSRLLEEILTRTGVGTMIERLQSHHVDYAREEDLDDVHRLHVESQQYRSPLGTPYVKPLEREELSRLLPWTFLLQHRGVLIGKLHAVPVLGKGATFHIGGLVVAEDHQDSQQAQLLLSEVLDRLRDRGCSRAVAITASQRAQSLFTRMGAGSVSIGRWQSAMIERAALRYAPAERHQVQLFEFALKRSRRP